MVLFNGFSKICQFKALNLQNKGHGRLAWPAHIPSNISLIFYFQNTVAHVMEPALNAAILAKM